MSPGATHGCMRLCYAFKFLCRLFVVVCQQPRTGDHVRLRAEECLVTHRSSGLRIGFLAHCGRLIPEVAGNGLLIMGGIIRTHIERLICGASTDPHAALGSALGRILCRAAA